MDADEAMHAGDAPKHDSSGDGLECAVGGYIVRGRRADVWDAIITLLAALDAEHGNSSRPMQAAAVCPTPCRKSSLTICCRHRSNTSTASRSNGSAGDRSKATRRPPTPAPSSKWHDSRLTRDQERRRSR